MVYASMDLSATRGWDSMDQIDKTTLQNDERGPLALWEKPE
jgi:hypothetical protein